MKPLLMIFLVFFSPFLLFAGEKAVPLDSALSQNLAGIQFVSNGSCMGAIGSGIITNKTEKPLLVEASTRLFLKSEQTGAPFVCLVLTPDKGLVTKGGFCIPGRGSVTVQLAGFSLDINQIRPQANEKFTMLVNPNNTKLTGHLLAFTSRMSTSPVYPVDIIEAQVGVWLIMNGGESGVTEKILLVPGCTTAIIDSQKKKQGVK